MKERRSWKPPPLPKVGNPVIPGSSGTSWEFIWGLAVGMMLGALAVFIWWFYLQEKYPPIAGG